MTVARERRSDRICVLHISGPLRFPIDARLRHTVRALLARGERRLVLDLSQVSRIDAAGVGELVRAYNMAAAVNGQLRITHATVWVREVLELVGVYDLLSTEIESD
jgi:anti-sigma B factor antagonist